MSLYGVQKVIYELNRSPQALQRFRSAPDEYLSAYELDPQETQALQQPDIGLLYVLGVNGQLLMHFAAAAGLPSAAVNATFWQALTVGMATAFEPANLMFCFIGAFLGTAVGVLPGIGGTQRLTRAVGKAKAMEMCLTGRFIDAVEAERCGIVARIVPADELLEAQALLRRMPVGDKVVEAILDLVRACRPTEPEGVALAGHLAWGPGPRAAQALMLTVRARALLDGRLAPSIADVAAMARPVLEHRMALSFAARARGETLTGLIDRVTSRTLRLEAAA